MEYAFCIMAIAVGQSIGPLVAGFTRIDFGWSGMTDTLCILVLFGAFVTDPALVKTHRV